MTINPIANINLFNSAKVELDPALEERQSNKSATRTPGRVQTRTIRLGVPKNLFSESTESFSILTTCTGTPYLQATSNGSGSVILGDPDTTGTPVAIINRGAKGTFTIYSVDDTSQLTPVANVKQVGKVLHVILEGDSAPTYTINNIVSHPSRRFETRHVIKKQGERVASTRYGNGNSYILTIHAGSDACLMTCLAAIANEVRP